MNATNTNAATVKENLTVQPWGIEGESVVKHSLKTAIFLFCTRQPVSNPYKLPMTVDVCK